MTQPPNGNVPASPLQFDTVEPGVVAPQAAPVRLTCLGCRRPITEAYYAIRDKPICAGCRAAVMAKRAGKPITEFLLATIYGLGAGLAGAAVWFFVRYKYRQEWGLIALAVGYMVAKGVVKGSNARGGKQFQFLALFLTYFCVSMSYAANYAVVGLTDGRHYSALVVTGVSILAFVFGLAAPVMENIKRPMGLIIVGIALYEAWKLSAVRRLPITGPYYVAAAAPIPAPLPPLPSGVRA